MAWALEEAAEGVLDGSDNSVITFAGAPSAGELIVLCGQTDNSSPTTAITAPSGFQIADSLPIASRSLIVFYKEAGASEGTEYVLTNAGGQDVAGAGAVWSGESLDSVGETATGSATNVLSVTTDAAITGNTNSLLIAVAFYEGVDQATTWSTGFTSMIEGNSGTDRIDVAYAIGDGGSEQPTHTLASQVTRQSILLVEFIPTAGGGGDGFRPEWARASNVLLQPGRAA